MHAGAWGQGNEQWRYAAVLRLTRSSKVRASLSKTDGRTDEWMDGHMDGWTATTYTTWRPLICDFPHQYEYSRSGVTAISTASSVVAKL
eukprot:365874-Chlamydomonas_euryale.AAC.5